MRRRDSARRTPAARLLVAFALATALGLSGCGSSKPQVLCTLENPTTGRRVELYKEISYKVPASYDEAQHVATWKAEQGKLGYTREVQR